VGPFHFIENNAFIIQRFPRFLEFVVPAFLLEDVRSEPGIKHRIEIHIHEIVKILNILAGDRVTRLVRIGHGVQECLERTLEKLYERFPHRVFAGAAQNGMFQDVSHARGIPRRRSKGDPEHLVLIVIDERQEFGSCPGMLKKLRLGSKLGDLSFSKLGEAVG
jgi:hypothetical protein